MDNLLVNLIQQAPYIAAIITVVYMFQRSEEKREQQRVENAKALDAERQAQIRELNNMWANNIKQIVEQHAQTQVALMTALKDHDKASQERYEKIGITNDLIQAVKTRNQKS